MATTIPGGKYLSPDGKTYHDAEGKILSAPEPDEAMAVAELEPQPEVAVSPVMATTVAAPVVPPTGQPGPKAVIAKKG